MSKKQNSASVFCRRYTERNPVEWVKRFFRQWKWAYQRATKGFCDYDTWSIDSWFLTVLPAMLDQLADETHGFPEAFLCGDTRPDDAPTGDTPEDPGEKLRAWQDLLHQMASKFRDADEEQCSMKNPYEDDWLQACKEFEKEYGLFGEKLEQDAIHRKEPGIRAHFPDEFPQWKEITDKYREKEQKIWEFREASLSEAMELFHRSFWSLWD